MKHCSMRSSDHCKDLLASLHLLSVPLLEDCIPGIVSSFELGEIKTTTSVLIKHLHDLDGRDLVTALLFLSTVTSARADADDLLTTELIDQTYRHMRRAESERHPGITGAAMTLLANIAVYRCEEVMERLEKDEEHPQSSSVKTLHLISTKSSRVWNKRRNAAQNTLSVDDLITHAKYETGPPEGFDFCYHLLHPSYGFKNHWNCSLVFRDTDTMRAAMCRYITCVLTDKERRKVTHYLHIAIRSAFRTSYLISVMFFSELLRHPKLLEKKVAKDVISLVALNISSNKKFKVCLVMELIGNAMEGAPREMHQLKDFIFDCLSMKLQGYRNLEGTINILKLLSKFVTLLKRSKLGRTFEKIVELCTKYLNHWEPLFQAYSTSLFADLAKNCNRSKKDFSQHIRRHLPDLLIKLHSKDQQVKAAGIAALLHCLPYIGCNNVEALLSADGEKYCQIYEQIWQKTPGLLVYMMLHSTELLEMADKVDAVLEHLTMIRDTLPYEELPQTALCDLFMNLRDLLTGFSHPKVKEATNRAIAILATKWKSIGTVKVVKFGTDNSSFFKRIERVEIIFYETSV
ncbi:uncharacterized protein ACNLHF_009520 [Anomaloglossus baeobatrachus]|uniref:uncharacterized protein LOC142290657 n=1 Tax=Anomaloglossus baeobatrachus TaxID=238106 RepID=UPI003F5084CD